MGIHQEIDKLPECLRSVMMAVVAYVRAISPEGSFKKDGNRWVYRPKNFVTFNIHYKQAKNVRVSFRGIPCEYPYEHFPELPLKPGLHGYSECSVKVPEQLTALVFYIRRAEVLYSRGRMREPAKQRIIEE